MAKKCKAPGCGNLVANARCKYCSDTCRIAVRKEISRRSARKKRRQMRSATAKRTGVKPGEKWNCLRCDKLFEPEGRFNRICPKCNRENRGVSVREVRYYGPIADLTLAEEDF